MVTLLSVFTHRKVNKLVQVDSFRKMEDLRFTETSEQTNLNIGFKPPPPKKDDCHLYQNSSQMYVAMLHSWTEI